MLLRGRVGRPTCLTAAPDIWLGGCVREATRAGGRPLPAAVRRAMERPFRTGLRAVRVHTGPAAAAVADRLKARAVTAGRHILFAAGEYALHTSAGRRLLAHELTHVLQQRRGRAEADRPTGVGPADDRFEREADRAAELACAGRRVPALTSDPSGLVRRVVRPDMNTATITTIRGPAAQLPRAPNPLHNADVYFRCGTWNGDTLTNACLTANASVVVNGDPAVDSLAGWRFGFIQVQWIETNWGIYHGRQPNHGSTFLQRGRPPARPAQACRDTDDETGAHLFYDPRWVSSPFPFAIPFLNNPASFPRTITVNGWNDSPYDSYPLQVNNRKSGQLNFLHEAMIEFHFLTVFSALSPANRIQHLAHFFWNVHWQDWFQPSSFVNRLKPIFLGDDGLRANIPWLVTPVAKGNTVHVSPTYLGTPTGGTARHRAMIALLDPTAVTTQSCNRMAQRAAPLPAGFAGPQLFPQRENLGWEGFNLDR